MDAAGTRRRVCPQTGQKLPTEDEIQTPVLLKLKWDGETLSFPNDVITRWSDHEKYKEAFKNLTEKATKIASGQPAPGTGTKRELSDVTPIDVKRIKSEVSTARVDQNALPQGLLSTVSITDNVSLLIYPEAKKFMSNTKSDSTAELTKSNF